MVHARLLSVLITACAVCCSCQQLDMKTCSATGSCSETRQSDSASDDGSDTGVFLQTGIGDGSTGDASCPDDITAKVHAEEFWKKYFEKECDVDMMDLPETKKEIRGSSHAYKPLITDGPDHKGCRVESALSIGKLIFEEYPPKDEGGEWVGDNSKAILQMDVDGSATESPACALFDTLENVPKLVTLSADDVGPIVDKLKKIYTRECSAGKKSPEQNVYLCQDLSMEPVVAKRSDSDPQGSLVSMSLTLCDGPGGNRKITLSAREEDMSEDERLIKQIEEEDDTTRDAIEEKDTLDKDKEASTKAEMMLQEDDTASYIQRRLKVESLGSEADSEPSTSMELNDVAPQPGEPPKTGKTPDAVGKLSILDETISPPLCTMCGKCQAKDDMKLLEDHDEDGKIKEQARLYPDHKPGVFLKVETAKAGSPEELKPPPIPGNVVTRGSFRVDTVDMEFGDNFHSHIMPKRTEEDHKRVWAQSRALIQTVEAELRAKNQTSIPDSYHFYDSDKTAGCFQPAYNQGKCGSCWAFASLGALEKQICLRAKSNVVPSLSREMLVRCSEQNNACGGGNADKAYEDLMEIGGVFSTDCLPYQGEGSKHCPVFAYSWFGQGSAGKTGKFARIDQELQKSCGDHTRYSNRPPMGKEWDMPFQMMYEARFNKAPDMNDAKLMRFKRNFAKTRSRDRVPSWWLYGETAMKAAIVKYGSIYASFKVQDDFKKRQCKDGCWPPGTVYGEEPQFRAATCGCGSGHAVHIIGYGEDIQETGTKVPYWLIENSWGTDTHGNVWGEDTNGAKGFGKDPFTELHPMGVEDKCVLAGWIGSAMDMVGGCGGNQRINVRDDVKIEGGAPDGMVFSISINGVDNDTNTNMTWTVGKNSGTMFTSVLPFKPGPNEYTFRIYAKNHPKQQGMPLESYSVTAMKVRCRGKGFSYSFTHNDTKANLSWGRKTRKELKAEADALIPIDNSPNYLYGDCKEACRTGRYSWAKPCVGLLTTWGSCYTQSWAKRSSYIKQRLRANCEPCTENAVKLKQKAEATRTLDNATFLQWFTLVEQSWTAPDDPTWMRKNVNQCAITTGGFVSNAQLSATYTFSMPEQTFCDERHSAPYAVGKFVHAPKYMADGDKAEQRCPPPMVGTVQLECRSGALYALSNTCNHRSRAPEMVGKLGYYKTVRGVNYHGIESGAAFAIAEMNRFASHCPTLSWTRWSECNATTPCERGMQTRTRDPIGIDKSDPNCAEMLFYEERPCVGPGFCSQVLTRFVAGASADIEDFLAAYKTQSTTIKSTEYATAGAHMLQKAPLTSADCQDTKYWCKMTTGRDTCGLYFEGHFQVHQASEYILNYETEGGGGILEFNAMGEGNELKKQYQVRGGSSSALYEWQDLGFHHRRRRTESKPWVQTASLPLSKGTYFVRMTRTGWGSCPTFNLRLERLTSIYKPPVLLGASTAANFAGAKQKTAQWNNEWGIADSWYLTSRSRYNGRYGYAKRDEAGSVNEILVRNYQGGTVLGKSAIDNVSFTGEQLYTLLGINKFDLPSTVRSWNYFELVIRTTLVIPEAGEYVFKYQTDGAYQNQPWMTSSRRRYQKFQMRAGGKGKPTSTFASRQSSASKTLTYKATAPGTVQFEVSQRLDIVAPSSKMAMPNSVLMEMKKKDLLHGDNLALGSKTKYMSDLVAIRGDTEVRIDWPERDDPLSSELKTQTYQALEPQALLIGNTDVGGFAALAEVKIDAGACVSVEAWAKGEVGNFLGLGLNMCDTDGSNQYLELVTYHPPLPEQKNLTNYSINRIGWVHVGFTHPMHMKLVRDPTSLGKFDISYKPDNREVFATPFSQVDSGWTGKMDVGVSMNSPEAYRYAEFYNVSIEECPSDCNGGENGTQVYCGEVITACGNKLSCPETCSNGKTCREQTCMDCDAVDFTPAEAGATSTTPAPPPASTIVVNDGQCKISGVWGLVTPQLGPVLRNSPSSCTNSVKFRADCNQNMFVYKPSSGDCYCFSDRTEDVSDCTFETTGFHTYKMPKSEGPAPEPLKNKGGSGCTSRSKCPTCSGDCDRDSDCASGLKCFQRSGKKAVPGCGAGGTGDVSNYDYCYAPVQADKYHKLPVNSNDCPDGYGLILDVDKCRDALSALGYSYNNYYDRHPHVNRPTGCIWHSNGNGYFNPTGAQPIHDQAPICEKATTSTAPKVVKDKAEWECGLVTQMCTNTKGQKVQVKADVLDLGGPKAKAAPSMHHFCQDHDWECIGKSKWAYLAEGKECGTIEVGPETCGLEVKLFDCPMPNDRCEAYKCNCYPTIFSPDFNCGSQPNGCGKEQYFGSTGEGLCPGATDVCNNNVCCTPKTKADFPDTYECGTVLDGCGGGIEYEKVPPTPFMTKTPAYTTTNWFAGQAGLEFDLKSNSTISKFGRGLMSGKEKLQQTARVLLYSVETQKEIISIDVGPAAEVSNGYAWAGLPYHVKLAAGKYRLVQKTWYGMKDKWSARNYYRSSDKSARYSTVHATHRVGIFSNRRSGFPHQTYSWLGSGFDIVTMAFVDNDGCGHGSYSCVANRCENSSH